MIFINDIAQDIPVKIRLFADDFILYNEIHSTDDQVSLNKALSQITNWCTLWQMQINHSKTVAMTLARKMNPLTFTYSISGNNLSVVSSYKYLGVVITSDLRWNDHVTYIHQKAMRQLSYLRRTLPKASSDVKLLAYKTYIRPTLKYAAAVWDPHKNTNIRKLENIQ